MPEVHPDVVLVVDRARRRRWVQREGRFVPESWPPLDETIKRHPWLGQRVEVIDRELRRSEMVGIWTVERVFLREPMVIAIDPSADAPLEVWAELLGWHGRRCARAVAPLTALALIPGRDDPR